MLQLRPVSSKWLGPVVLLGLVSMVTKAEGGGQEDPPWPWTVHTRQRGHRFARAFYSFYLLVLPMPRCTRAFTCRTHAHARNALFACYEDRLDTGQRSRPKPVLLRQPLTPGCSPHARLSVSFLTHHARTHIRAPGHPPGVMYNHTNTSAAQSVEAKSQLTSVFSYADGNRLIHSKFKFDRCCNFSRNDSVWLDWCVKNWAKCLVFTVNFNAVFSQIMQPSLIDFANRNSSSYQRQVNGVDCVVNVLPSCGGNWCSTTEKNESCVEFPQFYFVK